MSRRKKTTLKFKLRARKTEFEQFRKNLEPSFEDTALFNEIQEKDLIKPEESETLFQILKDLNIKPKRTWTMTDEDWILIKTLFETKFHPALLNFLLNSMPKASERLFARGLLIQSVPILWAMKHFQVFSPTKGLIPFRPYPYHIK
jgi:hypothetical protein